MCKLMLSYNKQLPVQETSVNNQNIFTSSLWYKIEFKMKMQKNETKRKIKNFLYKNQVI